MGEKVKESWEMWEGGGREKEKLRRGRGTWGNDKNWRNIGIMDKMGRVNNQRLSVRTPGTS